MSLRKKIGLAIALLMGMVLVVVFAFNLWLNHQKSKPFKATEDELAQLEFYKQPESWFLNNLKEPRIVLDGQQLDPKFQYIFEEAGDSDENLKMMKLIFSTPLGRKYARHMVDREWNLYSKISPPMKVTFDLEVLGRHGLDIPIRLYVPKDDTDQKENLPVLVYAHGGGLLFGSVKAMDRVVQHIANEANVMVISVDYRLAPEHPYPSASDDGEDVFLWAKNNVKKYGGNPKNIAFGGDSGGGLVAINVAQRQLDQMKPPPTALLLYYPATGLPINDPSYTLFGKGYGLDANFFEYLLTQVFPDQSLETATPDDYMSPVQSEDLSNMPPTIVVTAGFDILRDSGKRFADKLKADSVAVTYFNYASLTHNFLQLSAIIEDADKATTETAQLLGRMVRE
ncbi:MAG: alpha/beta hydrolase fold domain-containing protein [Bacteroidota bacterium]